MSTQKDDIEQLFSAKFEKFEIQSSEEEWNRLSAKLRWSNFLKFNITSFNIYYLAALITLTGILVWVSILHVDSSKQHFITPDSIPAIQEQVKGPILPQNIDSTKSIKQLEQTSKNEKEKKKEPYEAPTINCLPSIAEPVVNIPVETSATDSIKVEIPNEGLKLQSPDTLTKPRIRKIRKVRVIQPDAVIVRDTVNISKQVN